MNEKWKLDANVIDEKHALDENEASRKSHKEGPTRVNHSLLMFLCS
jgi:hypothetical protein